jgi:hypothetical protein
MMSRSTKKSDEGHVCILTADNGDDHLAVLIKYEEVPGFSRFQYLNEFGDRPTEESKFYPPR